MGLEVGGSAQRSHGWPRDMERRGNTEEPSVNSFLLGKHDRAQAISSIRGVGDCLWIAVLDDRCIWDSFTLQIIRPSRAALCVLAAALYPIDSPRQVFQPALRSF